MMGAKIGIRNCDRMKLKYAHSEAFEDNPIPRVLPPSQLVGKAFDSQDDTLVPVCTAENNRRGQSPPRCSVHIEQQLEEIHDEVLGTVAFQGFTRIIIMQETIALAMKQKQPHLIVN